MQTLFAADVTFPFAAAFSSTINLGAVLVGLLVVVATGLFTIRSNVAKVWRENYEGEKERGDNLEAEAKKQREAKHEALTQLAAEKLKTDQTTVLTQLAEMQRATTEAAAAASAAMIDATRKSEERLVAQMQALTQTSSGLVEVVEKINRRLDDLERSRNNGQ